MKAVTEKETDICTDGSNHRMQKMRTTVIIWAILASLAVLAVPVGILLFLISELWSWANNLVRRLDSRCSIKESKKNIRKKRLNNAND